MPQAERLLLVGGDLMAGSRVQDAARRAGLDFRQVRRLPPAPDRIGDPPTIVVVDLDSGGRDALDALTASRESGDEPLRAIGYFSHVDAELGEAARRTGLEVYPRGRFWRTLPGIIAGGSG